MATFQQPPIIEIEKITYVQAKMLQVGDIGIYLLIIAVIGFILSIFFLKNKKSPVTVSFAKFTHSPYGQLLLTLIGILWASLISVFGSKLQEQWFEGKEWQAENLFFGVSVILAIMLSILHYIYSQVKEQQNQSRPSFDAISENSIQSVNSMRKQINKLTRHPL